MFNGPFLGRGMSQKYIHEEEKNGVTLETNRNVILNFFSFRTRKTFHGSCCMCVIVSPCCWGRVVWNMGSACYRMPVGEVFGVNKKITKNNIATANVALFVLVNSRPAGEHRDRSTKEAHTWARRDIRGMKTRSAVLPFLP